MESKDLIVQVNGVSICYDDYGNGKLPVIFIHGFPFSKCMWHKQVKHLQDLTRTIVYDLRGFGKSDSGKEKYSISLFADDLVKFMDMLMIDKTIICGLSMGGYIALNALYRYRNRFAGIILCDTQCIEDIPDVKAKRQESITLIEEKGLIEFADNFIKNLFTEKNLNDNPAIVSEVRQSILDNSPEAIKLTLKALAERWEMCSSINEIKIPTLILCGREDKLTPPNQSELMHKNITSSQMYLIDDAAHLSNLEQPIVFNNYLTHFVAGLIPIETEQ